MFVKNRGHWSSKFAFIIAATGAAVGLGNIWRFPYMVGMHGGSAFVLIYLICILIMGIPVMMTEFLIGRRSQCNSVDAMVNEALRNGRSPHWGLVGWWGAFALLLTLSMYSVVSGWVLAYIFKMLGRTLQGVTPLYITNTWTSFLHDPWQLTVWHGIFMIMTLWVVSRGVKRGLELACKIMMPLLYAILIILMVYASIAGNFYQAFIFLFTPDFSKIDASVVVAAMGHAFFSLALGAGAMLVYGSYLRKNVSIATCTFIIVILDVLVAFIAGLATFPILFAHGLPAESGPGLMFISLPISFSELPYGWLIGAAFFLVLLFAAWTSSINLAEPMVDIVIEKWSINRHTASIIVGAVAWFIGLGSVLSFNVWEHVRLFNTWNIFEVATNLPIDIILPIGGLCFAIFAGFAMTRKNTEQELAIRIPALYTLWRIAIRYIAPVCIVIIFVASFVDIVK